MNDRQLLYLTLSLNLVLLSFNLFVADSEPMSSSNMEGCKKSSQSFEEAWSLLRTAVDRIINKVEGVDNSSFINEDYMSYYTTVYELCTDRSRSENGKLLYIQCKKAVEEYINSTVLPSLRGKKDELLLRELLRRWSNHKTLTKWFSRIFHYLDRHDLPRLGLPSVEETSFLSFYDLVYDEMNKQVVDAVLSLIDQERAGEQIDRTVVNNTLAIYSEIGDSSRKNHAQGFVERLIKDNAEFHYDAVSHWIASSSFKDNTQKGEKPHENPIVSSKKINLVDSNGVVFEVDYNVALMSRTIEDLIKANPAGDTDYSIPLPLVSSKILSKVIEYCKKHTEEASSSNYFDVDIKEWDAEFVEVDQQTLFDLVLAANYMNIKSLLDLTTNKVADMIKGKTPSEIRKIFNIKEDFTPEEEKEHQ